MVSHPFTSVTVQQGSGQTPAVWSVTTTTVSGGNQKAVTVSGRRGVQVDTFGDKGKVTVVVGASEHRSPFGVTGHVESTPTNQSPVKIPLESIGERTAESTTKATADPALAVFGLTLFKTVGGVGTESRFDVSLARLGELTSAPATAEGSPQNAVETAHTGNTSAESPEWVMVSSDDLLSSSDELSPRVSRVSPRRNRVSISEHTPHGNVVDEVIASMNSRFEDQLATPPSPTSKKGKSPNRKGKKKAKKTPSPEVDESMTFFEIVSAYASN
eukprot:m.17926 g.17926  ORF g.17926 m.17926 type:complete len:272 (-) comp9455_c0_seq1:2921-3736(-)